MINIGSILYGKLHNVASTYPLVAENTATFPFIIYRTTQQRPVENKDMCYEWIYQVQISIVDDHYDKVCSLLEETINKVMELNESFTMNIESISEDFIDDAYVKQMNITIYI